MVLVTGLALVFGLGLVVLTALGAPRNRAADGAQLVAPASYRPADLDDSPVLGPPSAPVVLEVWSDYQCPVCGRFAREYLPRLVRDFVAQGRLRIVEQSIDILGRGDPSESTLAAVAADCAGRQDRHWAYHDWLFANQAGENRGAFARDRLVGIGDRLGLDTASFETCLDSPEAAAAVRDRTQPALAAGIRSTPTFVVNGQRIVGLVPYAELAGVIADLGGGSPAPLTPSPSGS
jgi:protein-disulfide isomerase